MPNATPDLPILLDAIRAKPDRGFGWLALAAWLCGKGRHDEADAVRVFWPTPRDHIKAGHSVHTTLRGVARRAAIWGRRARQVEQQTRARSPGGRPANPRTGGRDGE